MYDGWVSRMQGHGRRINRDHRGSVDGKLQAWVVSATISPHMSLPQSQTVIGKTVCPVCQEHQTPSDWEVRLPSNLNISPEGTGMVGVHTNCLEKVHNKDFKDYRLVIFSMRY